MSASALATLSAARCAQVVRLFQGLQITQPVVDFVRVMETRYSNNPLGLSGGPSRFSPLPAGSGHTPKFAVLYLAQDLATAVHESLIRARFDLNPSRILMPTDYAGHDAANISTLPGQTLTLLDLARGNAVRYGVPTDVIRYSLHADGQRFSEFGHAEIPAADGFLYSSRLTERPCIAVYGRACHKLEAGSPMPLRRPLLAPALSRWNVDVR